VPKTKASKTTASSSKAKASKAKASKAKASKTKASQVPEYDELDFSDMTLVQYGKGLLLTPADGDNRAGTKYFHGGFWMPKQNGWFFKMTYYEFIVENGVNNDTGVEHAYVNAADVTPISERFSEMAVTEHGKGYLMTCDHKSNPLRGEKYLTQPKGYWNKTLKGWTFGSDALDDLIDQGAVYMGEEAALEINRFDDMTVIDHGRGYLMMCDQKSNPLRGEKYIHDPTGYWNKTLDGWTFGSLSLDALISQGAVYVSEAEVSAEAETIAEAEAEDDDLYELFTGMKYRTYGKGYLLMSHGDKRAGTKYFHGGFWIPKVNGWFFKKEMKSFLRENGASKTKYITPEIIDDDE